MKPFLCSSLQCKAKYIGKDGSMGYRTERTYTVDVWIDDGYIYVNAVENPVYKACPYKMSMISKCWKFI